MAILDFRSLAYAVARLGRAFADLERAIYCAWEAFLALAERWWDIAFVPVADWLRPPDFDVAPRVLAGEPARARSYRERLLERLNLRPVGLGLRLAV